MAAARITNREEAINAPQSAAQGPDVPQGHPRAENGSTGHAGAVTGTSGIEALARVLALVNYRGHRRLAEADVDSWCPLADALVADPVPLLEALAEAGVLEVEGSVRRGCGCRVREGNITAACCYLVGEGGPDVPERRYVTAWQEAQP